MLGRRYCVIVTRSQPALCRSWSASLISYRAAPMQMMRLVSVISPAVPAEVPPVRKRS